MSAIKLSTRYAKSLLDLSSEKGILEEVEGDILMIAKMLEDNPAFIAMLNPVIPSDRKLQTIEAIMNGKIHDVTARFLKLLLKKGREGYLRDICRSFSDQHDTLKGITRVTIKTATELDDVFIEKILSIVKQDADVSKIELQTEVDEGILGGFVLTYKDKLFDTSIQRHMDILRTEFKYNKYIREF